MVRLLIIADDFTGALDTGVQFSKCGAATRVITGSRVQIADYTDSCDVLVIDSETRHVSAEAAYKTVYNIVIQAKKLGISHIYKKTDSALRGNVGAELAAVLDASGEQAIAFFPAFPQMGRNTVCGIHYIEGTPVAQSVFGSDPFSPVKHSRVTDLLAEQTQCPANSFCAVTETGRLPKENGIWVFDASCREELISVGQCLKQENRLHIMAGCAGFASVLPNLLGLASEVPQPIPKMHSRFTIVCGSVNPITVSQITYAKQYGMHHVWLSPEQKLNLKYWESAQGQEDLQNLKKMLEKYPLRILDTNDWNPSVRTVEYAAQNNLTVQDVREAVSGTVGYLVSQLFSHPDIGTLLITGGDTLLQCMEFMGVQEIQPLCELDAGVVLARFEYGGVTRNVITKSGGFGTEDLFVRLYDKLLKQ